MFKTFQRYITLTALFVAEPNEYAVFYCEFKMNKSKEYQAIEKARIQYDGESCEHTKRRLKRFILTQCEALERKGEMCTDLYFDLMDNTSSTINSRNSKKILIEESEFARLVKSDNKLVDLQRKSNNLELRVKKLQAHISDTKTSKTETALELIIAQQHSKIQNQREQLMKLTAALQKKQSTPEVTPQTPDKIEAIKRLSIEREKELSCYKKAFTEFKKIAIDSDMPEILVIIQKTYFEIDEVREKVRSEFNN